MELIENCNDLSPFLFPFPAWRKIRNFLFAICTWPNSLAQTKILSNYHFQGKNGLWISQVRRVKVTRILVWPTFCFNFNALVWYTVLLFLYTVTKPFSFLYQKKAVVKTKSYYRSVNFKRTFWYPQFFQKTSKNNSTWSIIVLLVRLICSFFGRIEDTKKSFWN